MSTPLKPVVQVGTKQLTLDQRLQTAIGGGDDSRVDAVRAVAADALDGEVLNGAQQLGLRRQRQVGHLVEEQRAAVGVLELAAPALDAGGRPFLDAEQLGLQQRFDQRGAVDRHERPVPPPAQLVNLAGDQLLARRRSRPRAGR